MKCYGVHCSSLPDSNRIISRLSTLDPFQLVTSTAMV
nr:MAG TPA: hypothetical protein [Caudoviricetes sp.]